MKRQWLLYRLLKYYCLIFVISFALTATVRAQTAVSTVTAPPALTVEGVSPIDKSAAEKVSRYTASRSARLLSWQPNKREMLISTRFGETAQIHRVARAGGARTQLTFFSDSVSRAAYQPTNADYFVFLKDQAGDENFHLYRQNFATGDYEQLTSVANEIDSVDSFEWLKDGGAILYIGVKLKESQARVCLLNPTNPRTPNCIANLKNVLWQIADISPDNSKALLYEYIATGKSAVHLLDLKTGKLERLTPDVEAVFSNALFSRDEKKIYLSTNQDGEFERPAQLDLTTKQINSFLPNANAGLEEFAVSPDGKTIATVYNDNGSSRLAVWNAKTDKQTHAPELPAGVVTELRWLSDVEIGFNLETARFPADVYAFNLKTSNLERWTSSETGGINTASFREAELIKWQARDGKTISGVLYRPPVAKNEKLPILIDVHGGPQTQARPNYAGRYNFLLKEMGVAVIFPNVRGSTGFGKTFMAADNGAKRADALADLQALLDWIKTQPDLDANRIAVRGESYGGFLALALGMTEPDRIKGVIATSPVISVSQYISKSQPALQQYLRAEYGDERDPAQIEFLNRLSPLANEENWRLPILLAIGKRDSRVPVGEVETLQVNLRKRRIPVAFLAAANEGHVWRNKENRDYFFFAMTQFLHALFKD